MKRSHGYFQLRVFPLGDTEYGVELTQRVDGQPRQRVVRSWGVPMRAVGNHLLEAIKHSGYRPADLKRTRRKPFAIPEPVAVRLGLALLAVKPLQKPRRIEEVASAVRQMCDDEAYYWYAKCTQTRTGRRARRAFRDLVSER